MCKTHNLNVFHYSTVERTVESSYLVLKSQQNNSLPHYRKMGWELLFQRTSRIWSSFFFSLVAFYVSILYFMDPKQWWHCTVKFCYISLWLLSYKQPAPVVTSVEPTFELSLKLCNEELSYKQSLLSATGTAFLNYPAAGIFLCF